jgi:transcriptional regulator with XRE-family HTH domain
MTEAHGYLKQLLSNLKALREKAGMSEAALEEKLILGPGWVRRFEQGETIPSIDMLLAILHETGANLDALLKGLPGAPDAAEVERFIFAEQEGDDIIVHFRYANFDAQYLLRTATVEQFEAVIKTLRDGLARLASADDTMSEAIKTEAVAACFLMAVKTWPHANPSDLWWFVVYRAYCDPYNHPAQYARLDFTQSWKRTGGWALEEILVRHYGPFLKTHGINLFIANGAAKQAIIKGLKVGDRLEADKIDVVLSGDHQGQQKFFGVVHVKASFAERRTDDVPMSLALVKHGFTSPLWTMDCKSTPSATPTNRGELGDAEGDRRSAKRKDIEDEGYFSGCFSYNKNTAPSGKKIPPERTIYVCDFRNPDDAFSKFIIQRWRAFQTA